MHANARGGGWARGGPGKWLQVMLRSQIEEIQDVNIGGGRKGRDRLGGVIRQRQVERHRSGADGFQGVLSGVGYCHERPILTG